MQILLNCLIALIIWLIILECIRVLPNTIHTWIAVNKLANVVEMSKTIIYTGLHDVLKDGEQIVVKNNSVNSLIEKKNGVIYIDGLALFYYRRKVLEEALSISQDMSRVVTEHQSKIIFSKFVLNKCEIIKNDIVEVQAFVDKLESAEGEA